MSAAVLSVVDVYDRQWKDYAYVRQTYECFSFYLIFNVILSTKIHKFNSKEGSLFHYVQDCRTKVWCACVYHSRLLITIIGTVVHLRYSHELYISRTRSQRKPNVRVFHCTNAERCVMSRSIIIIFSLIRFTPLSRLRYLLIRIHVLLQHHKRISHLKTGSNDVTWLGIGYKILTWPNNYYIPTGWEHERLSSCLSDETAKGQVTVPLLESQLGKLVVSTNSKANFTSNNYIQNYGKTNAV